MPRKRTGTAFAHGDHFDVQVTLPDGTRSKRACLPPGFTLEDAKAEAARLTALAHRTGATLVDAERSGAGETVEEWGERWWQARKLRGLRVDAEIPRWRKWVLNAPIDAGTFGALPIASLGAERIEDVVSWLDAQVRADVLNWKTAANAWGLLSVAFDDACRAKDRALRVRRDNPVRDVRGPDRGQRKAKAWLHPSEVVKVLESAVVDIGVRRALALNVYLYTRPGELRALEWPDVDLVAGTVSVHRSILRDGTEDVTKTELARLVPIEPALRPLLVAMRAAADGQGRVIELPDDTTLAYVLRDALKAAGVDRAELFARSKTRKQITWYDLRATGITWLAIAGVDPLKIMQRAGHKNMETTLGYVRTAEAVRGELDAFPALPKGLSPEAPKGRKRIAPESLAERLGRRFLREIEWVDRDSNPGPED